MSNRKKKHLAVNLKNSNKLLDNTEQWLILLCSVSFKKQLANLHHACHVSPCWRHFMSQFWRTSCYDSLVLIRPKNSRLEKQARRVNPSTKPTFQFSLSHYAFANIVVAKCCCVIWWLLDRLILYIMLQLNIIYVDIIYNYRSSNIFAPNGDYAGKQKYAASLEMYVSKLPS